MHLYKRHSLLQATKASQHKLFKGIKQEFGLELLNTHTQKQQRLVNGYQGSKIRIKKSINLHARETVRLANRLLESLQKKAKNCVESTVVPYKRRAS